ncbi:type VI secretion system secreted protein VgrG [Pseudomonas marginalis]|uniref:type VI secretion system Vgr family protein n=1 Tax=Pseudomonas marginalis TaxID=298 RepID=UPI0020A1A2CA|nr:type VI secretion system tip protein VgrG [Pseudomonas marginalis]MCP1507118.1 type VI secretion system secreted protein VgrG [Pseudomonas marginalis]MCP1524622.1 type VI secretion system secreted protein VgrG [Pseudomonas marginalis]MDQ0503091.1 type VI secretion system secreted protein VgrG [Pseudomonas marginalis]
MLNPLRSFYDHSRHTLSVRDVDALLDVLAFEGKEGLSQPFTYRIEFTSTDGDIAAEKMLGQNASFSLHGAPQNASMRGFNLPASGPLRTLHGVVTGFKRLSGSADEARYEITLQPHLALLGQGKQFRIYQHQSVPQIVESILRSRHDFDGQDFLFSLVREYPKREQVMQYGESDLAFISRLLADVGIWYRFTSDERLNIDVVEFHDDQRHYQFDVALAYRPQSGLSSSGQDGVWALQSSHQVVEQHVNIRTYQHRVANAHLNGDIDQTRGVSGTYGEAYHYAEPYTVMGDRYAHDEDLQSESGYFYARLRHERYLNGQTRLSGISSSATLEPGQVLNISGGVPQAFAPGAVITQLISRAARDASYEVTFEAIPYSETVCFRPELQPKPQIPGTVPARVTSPQANDPYGHIDIEGRYKVNFLFDRDAWKPGEESLWLRLARPYAGDTHGLHLPLIPGTEVAIAFEQGDPDRPYIAHALHDSLHVDHVTLRNYKRNVLRTPANNKLRMDDTRGQEHIKVSTEHSGKSQLNLGHLVDAKRKKRGEGFELRTDGWGAIRGGKGLFISADEQDQVRGKQLDMAAAIAQLEGALSLARSMAQAASSGQVNPGDTDSQLGLQQRLQGLAQPCILLHAPAGIGVLSPRAICLSSGGESVGIMAARNTDISAGHDITATAEGGVSVFAQRAELLLKAAQGKVELHAQGSNLHALAKTDVKIESIEGRIEIKAPQELVLNCGGAYIRLKDGDIELGAPGNIYLKATDVKKFGSTSLNTPASALPTGYAASYTVKDAAQAALRFSRYRITTQQGEVFNGVTDKHGKTMSVHTALPGNLKIELPETEKWISFSAPSKSNYQGIKCTATMDDGEVLEGEFDGENKASFYSFTGNACVKFEVQCPKHQEDLPSTADELLRELGE